MNTTRAQVLQAFADRLTTIRVANDFETEAGALVFLGEAPGLGKDDPDQAIAIVPGDEEQDWQAPGKALQIRLPVAIHALTKVDVENGWLAVEAMIRDIKRAIETAGGQLSDRMSWPLERGRVLTLRREEGSENAGAAVMYRAIYKEPWGLV